MYRIGEREFEIKPLVLGQVRQIAELFEDTNLVELFSQDIDSFLKIVGKKLPRFLAIVLREKGKPLKDKDLDELTSLIEEEVDITTALRMVRDFFGVNDIRSLIEEAVRTVNEAQDQSTGTGLRNSSSSSRTATSQSGTRSSGTTH